MTQKELRNLALAFVRDDTEEWLHNVVAYRKRHEAEN